MKKWDPTLFFGKIGSSCSFGVARQAGTAERLIAWLPLYHLVNTNHSNFKQFPWKRKKKLFSKGEKEASHDGRDCSHCLWLWWKYGESRCQIDLVLLCSPLLLTTLRFWRWWCTASCVSQRCGPSQTCWRCALSPSPSSRFTQRKHSHGGDGTEGFLCWGWSTKQKGDLRHQETHRKREGDKLGWPGKIFPSFTWRVSVPY